MNNKRKEARMCFSNFTRVISICIALAYTTLCAQSKSSSKWSANQGKMDWEDAKKKCASLGMRLPTMEELKAAYTAGITESWKTDGNSYWSSTPADEDHVYYLLIYDGGVSYDSVRNAIHVVRCLR